VHLAWRDVEVDAVEGDDLAEGLAEPPRTNGRPAGGPAGRRVLLLVSGCPETRQFVSGLGMNAPGTSDGA
jgi:hypothetical protein